MPTLDEISAIFNRIKKEYDEPVPIGRRCESYVYYSTEDLEEEELILCAEYVADRMYDLLSPDLPEVLLKLPGGHTTFAERLREIFSKEYLGTPDSLPLEKYTEEKLSNGLGSVYRGKKVVLVTDVITTARSSLEAHSKATLIGMKVLCWATLIDRTFGPGPVPVVSAYTGAPVRVLTQLG